MNELKLLEDAVEEVPTVWAILHKLIDKVAWHTEEELKEAHAAINAVDPDTKDLPVPPKAEPLPEVLPPTVDEQLAASAAMENTGGVSTHAASGDTTEASPEEAPPVPLVAPDAPEAVVGGGVGDPALKGTPMPPDVAAWLAANGADVAVVAQPEPSGTATT